MQNQSFPRTKKARRPQWMRAVLAVLLVLALVPVLSFVMGPTAKAYDNYSKNWSTEYYYPSGTKFVKNFQLTWDSSQNDAKSQCKPNGFSSGSTFPDSYNAIHDYTTRRGSIRI